MQNTRFIHANSALLMSTIVLVLLTATPQANAADTAKIQPGQWRSSDTVIEMTNPALSAEVIARRKANPTVIEYCVKSDDLRTLLVGNDKLRLCKSSVSFDNGRISITRNCTTGLGKSIRKIEGTYTATKTDTVRETKNGYRQRTHELKNPCVE